MLSINMDPQDKVMIIRVKGDVDEEGVKQLRIALVNCLREGHFHVVMNLSEMSFISYMGVGVLVERLRQFRSSDGDMKLVGLNLYTQRLFRMTGVTSLFDTYETDLEAIEGYLKAA